MTEILESSDQDFKAAIMKLFQQAITNILGTNEKVKFQQGNSVLAKK